MPRTTALIVPLLLGLPAVAAADDLGADGDDRGTTWESDDQRIDYDDGGEAIINGTEATVDDYPMTGGMMLDAYLDMGSWGAMDVRMFVCSSTLIAPDVVLLAAHCIDDYALTYGFGTVSDKEIRWTREADLSAHDGTAINEWPEDSVKAWDWVTPDEWDLTNLQMGIATNYDIALLFLEEPITDVPHAYLPTAEEAAQVVEGMEVGVVGWGQQIATSGWEAPPEGSYGYKQQGMSFINELGEAEFQVGAEEDDVRKCHGDSGGPSFAWIETDTVETMRLIGVTSHSYDSSDCNSKGGVDTRVDYYLDWIDEEMRSRCEDGTRAWCEEPGIVPAPYPEPEEEDAGVDGEEKGDEEGKLLGCATSPASPASGLGLLALFGLALSARRRR